MADLLERRWQLSIIYAALSGALRFNEFAEAVAGISPRMLSERLHDLEAAGLRRPHRDSLEPTDGRVPAHRARAPARPDPRRDARLRQRTAQLSALRRRWLVASLAAITHASGPRSGSAASGVGEQGAGPQGCSAPGHSDPNKDMLWDIDREREFHCPPRFDRHPFSLFVSQQRFVQRDFVFARRHMDGVFLGLGQVHDLAT